MSAPSELLGVYLQAADNDYFQSNLDNGHLGKNVDGYVAKREHEDYVECLKAEAELHSRCKVAFQ